MGIFRRTTLQILCILFLFPFVVYTQIYKEKSLEMGINHHCYDPNMMGGGVTVFDFNNDGFEDIYFTGGLNDDKLYENIGGEYFKDVSDLTRVSSTLSGVKTMGAVAGDVDNDGFIDLFITTSEGERCYLLKNNNGVSFSDISMASGIREQAWSSTATMGDYDLDGDLDIYVGNYLTYGDLPFMDNIIDPEPDFFYKNDGSGNFVKINSPLNKDENGCTLVASFSDIDQDGDADLFVLNDFGDFYEGNKLLLNQYPQNGFMDISRSSRLSIEINSMGIAPGDYDEDGDLDYYITNIGENFLFEKQQGLDFINVSRDRKVNDGTGFSWGAAFMDVDNDGYLDLFVSKGSILAQGNPQGNKFYLYDKATNTYLDKSVAEGMADENRARGMAYGDFNNDGKIDFSVANIRIDQANEGKALLYINEVESDNNWTKIILEGTTSNKSAYGATIELLANGRKLIKELTGGSSYLSSHSNRVFFGLGDINSIDQLTINWPGGSEEVFTNLEVNKTYKIIQEDHIYTHTSIYKKICQGDGVFIDGEDRTAAGIYKEVVLNDEGIDEIKITRLDVDISSGHCDVENDDDTDNGPSTDYSIARKWNELLLESIRNDYARPTVHARNLFHVSIAMYDAWAVFSRENSPFFLGNTLGDYTFLFEGVPMPNDIGAAQEEAISYACFGLLSHRFKNSPGFVDLHQDYKDLMIAEGYDVLYDSVDYSNGSPAALGNYIAQQLITFGLQDGSSESIDYGNTHYIPINAPLVVDEPGNPTLSDPDRWQPLTLSIFIDQGGNVIGDNTPDFLSPEWGRIVPFALRKSALSEYRKEGFNYKVYHDPGKPVELDTNLEGLQDPYKWGFAMVAAWSSHLDPNDNRLIDISPASIGNIDISNFPNTFGEYQTFYNFLEGGDIGKGHTLNPVTGLPYQTQMVPMGDYARVLAEFWADGPDSETPPGHWYTILNYVSDHPLTEKKFEGKGEALSNLEWDVKSYLILGGAMHDSAISAWGIKGYYDFIRPLSAIRYMASKGQSTDNGLDNYHPEGIPLVSNYIEVVEENDPLAGENGEYVGEIKIKAWKGKHFIDNPRVDAAGVDWILAMDWVPYQRPSFVTPPFAGYVSGHSTFSRAAAEVLTLLTGSKFFPGGMGVFDTKKNEFLVFEDGPSVDLTLQWATYQDASDQCSLSRIWGGIHPPIDDIPGRLIGHKIGIDAFNYAKKLFNEIPEVVFQQNKILMSPNPIRNGKTLHIAFKDGINEMVHLKLVDLNGRVLCKQNLKMRGENAMSFRVCAQNTGLYVVIGENDSGSVLFSKKVLIVNN